MGNSGTENREAALPLGLQEMTQGRRGDLGEVQTVLESEAAAHRMVEFPGAPADGAGAQAPHQPGARKTHWREHPGVRESRDCARSLCRK